MCLDFTDLNKLMINENFPILNIDNLLDEIHGEIFFTKVDLLFRYH